MSDDLPPVDGHVAAATRSEQPRLQVRQTLMEALVRERIILELWGPLVPNEFDFGATTRDLWELWRAEVGELRAPPPRPTPRNYQETADALDLFQREVDALPNSTPPSVEPATIWYHGERSYSSDGQNPRNVSREQHNVLRAFLDKDVAIDTRTLELGGVSNVAAVINKLRKTFGEVSVQRPLQKGEGYFIRVRSLKEPD